MSLWSRLANSFRSAHLNQEIDEELRSHLEEAAAEGRDRQEAARAFGSFLRMREASRDVRSFAWIDSLAADTVFGYRQFLKHKTATAAAVFSLALAIGSCNAAFRLIDALLLRPLPVSNPNNLYVLNYGYIDDDGTPQTSDGFSYPCFRQMRSAVTKEAELFAVSQRERMGMVFASERESRRAYRQYVSGWMFPDLGLKPALGRAFTAADDVKPGAHPYAMLSYTFWNTRLGRDPNIIGKTFRSGDVYQVIGITPKGFTGTETGGFTDVFYTAMSNREAVVDQNWNWLRIWVRPRRGASLSLIREQLGAALATFRREQVKSFHFGLSKEEVARYIRAPVTLEHASAGVSDMQKHYKLALTTLAGLVFLVLLIACANVANLMIAQGVARAREVALRISLGAGRWRLIQLLLVESAILATCASLVGTLIAWLAVPFVVSMISSPDNPVQLAMPADWRVLAFSCLLALLVTVLFGLGPAFRASGLKPASALKGGETRASAGLLNGLVAAQVAFCVFVYYSACLFIGTFERMSSQPTGFSSARVLTLETATKGKQPIENWRRVTDRLRNDPALEAVGLCWWPLMSGNGWSQYVWVNGHRSDEDNTPYFLKVSPGWLDTMRIRFHDGRDFREGDAFPNVAIVNETFARRFFGGSNPIGRSFQVMQDNKRSTLQVVGYVADARYGNMREPIHATAYVPFYSIDAAGKPERSDWASFVVRTRNASPMGLASALTREVSESEPDFSVVNVRTQEEMVRSQLLRERLLAALGLYFAGVAVTLAAAGIFGVLNYIVVRRRRELGIRLAIGARSRHIAWGVTRNTVGMTGLGGLLGIMAGVYSGRFVESLLYQITTTDRRVILIPLLLTVAVAFVAAVLPVARAVHLDPAVTLREE
jgi:predicted permease